MLLLLSDIDFDGLGVVVFVSRVPADGLPVGLPRAKSAHLTIRNASKPIKYTKSFIL